MLQFRKMSLWVSASLMLILAVTATANNNLQGGFTSPDKSIMVSAQQPQFTLRLKSNPATGYSWLLVSYDHDLLTPVSHRYVAPLSQLVGAAGYELWTFKLKSQALLVPQVTKVVMRYARGWEANSGNDTVFTVVVK